MNLIFTIGYGGRSLDEFLGLLQSKGIKTVVDVRLRPDRASMGYYTKAKTPDKGIQAKLSGARIDYVSLVELGNIFLDFEDWRERFAKLLELAGEMLTERLKSIPGPFCLLCAEKLAADCHRKQIADYLQGLGWEVEHIQ